MSKLKTLTDEAMPHRREAHVERRYRPIPVLAQVWDRAADKLVTLPSPPDVGVGGEVVREHAPPEGTKHEVSDDAKWKRREIRNTLAEGASRIAEDASIQRVDLLMQPSFDSVAMAIDTAESIQAENSVEKMLAHQMAVAHGASLRLLNRALSYEAGGRAMREGDSVEACRLANSAVRLMGAFNDAALTLQKLRTGGNQTVTVQHVSVAPGAQAVIGNVSTGGRGDGGSNGKRG